MPVPKSSRKQRRKVPAKGWLLLLVFIAGAGALIVFLVHAGDQYQRLSSKTLCPMDHGTNIPKILVILFDQTDRLTRLEQEALKSRFSNLIYDEFENPKDGVSGQFSRVEIYSFSANKGDGSLTITKDLVLCNPGKGAKLDGLFRNPEQVRRRFEKQFKGRLNHKLLGILDFKESRFSPILEAFKYVSHRVLENPRYRKSQKRLIVVSNMVHNTNGFTMLRPHAGFDKFRRSTYGFSLLPNLAGVVLTVHVIQARVLKQQGAAFLKFWLSYFRYSGASAPRGQPILWRLR